MRALMQLNPHARVHGLLLVDMASQFGREDHSQSFFDKYREAITLIADYHPRRLRRIQRDLKRIALQPAAAGYYDHSLRTYWTDLGVLQQPVWRIATFIVHEATHARLLGAGIRYRTESGRPIEEYERRVETICIEAEIDFAARYTTSEEVIHYLRRTLDSGWWSDDKYEDRRVRRLRAMGVPEQLIRRAPRGSS